MVRPVHELRVSESPMPKHESTAINDLLNAPREHTRAATQGRFVEPGGPEPHDGLFVTARVPPAAFVPVAAHFPNTPAGPSQQRVAPLSPPPPPLPRRRAPNATPPLAPVRPIFEDDDDDAETTFDPVVAARFAAGSQNAPRSGFEEPLETVRVAALPPPELPGAPAPYRLAPLIAKLAVPFVALVVGMTCAVYHVVHRAPAPAAAPEAAPPPVVMAVTPPPAPEPAPSVAAAIAWKPTVVQPTITSIPEPTVEPIEEPIEEPKPAPAPAPVAAPVAKPRVHHAARPAVAAPAPKRTRRAEPAQVAVAEAPAKPTGIGPGKVTITSTPAALIYVDGRSTNLMTPKTLPLAAGSHKITLLQVSSRKAKTQEIDVPAGGAIKIAKAF